MTIAQRKKLSAQYLLPGDYLLIANTAGISDQSVSDYVNGKVANSRCAPYFETMIELRKEQVKTKIEQLTAQVANDKG